MPNVIFDGCFAGGMGYDGCDKTPPTAGSDGGAGGEIERSPPYTIRSRAFAGGDGGDFIDASRQTKGGDGGTDSGARIGEVGWDGLPCSLADKFFRVAADWRINGQTVATVGDVIKLSRIRGFVLNPVHIPNCEFEHLHCDPNGLELDHRGPIFDPDPTGCGFGTLEGG